MHTSTGWRCSWLRPATAGIKAGHWSATELWWRGPRVETWGASTAGGDAGRSHGRQEAERSHPESPQSPRGRTWRAGPGSAEHGAEHRHHSSGSPSASRLKLPGTKRKRAYQRQRKKFLSVIFCGIGKRETSYSICYPCKWNVTLKRPKRKVPFTKQGWSLGAGCLKCLSLINKIRSFSECLYMCEFTHHSLPTLISSLEPLQIQTPLILNSRGTLGKTNQASTSLNIRTCGVFSGWKSHCSGNNCISVVSCCSPFIRNIACTGLSPTEHAMNDPGCMSFSIKSILITAELAVTAFSHSSVTAGLWGLQPHTA